MGQKTVSLSQDEYRELLDFKLALTGFRTVAEVPSRGQLENDAEVALFLAERFGRIPMNKVLSDCCTIYGDKRTPSRSVAYRYWLKLRDIKARNE